ncbi:hypothetical protein NeNHUV3_09220 [Nereida sp. NH-UV-3]
MTYIYTFLHVMLQRSSKRVLHPQKSALRFFSGKYLQKLGGDFASPHFVQLGVAHG